MAGLQGKSTVQRRADIQDALKRARKTDTITLDLMAGLWGVTKPRFVNIRNEMQQTVGFPEPKPGPNNTHLYDARAALKVMWAYEVRNDQRTEQRNARQDEILGRTTKGRRDEQGNVASHTPSELATLSRLAADIEQRERNQRLYIPAAEVAAVAAEVFGLLSEFCGSLANQVDPNGKMSADIRKEIQEGGRQALLRIHGEMSDMLNADADTGDHRTAGSGKQTRRPGSPRARRSGS